MRGTPETGPVLPARARAGLTALVLAAAGATAGSRAIDSAQAQTDTAPPVDEAPQVVSPEELEGQLADPSEEPPRADRQGRADARSGARRGGTHVVEPGDSLWRIARAQLGGDPTHARVAHEVDRLWDRNSAAIGTGDPDLILPGQRLKLS